MDKHLHIVCFDVPYPADYGGVIDVFYRIKALHALGIKIHLHCFEYGRGKQDELNKYCVEVVYYKRYKGLQGFSLTLPYIVRSRANKDLLHNLLRDNHPILLEGIHTTYFLFTKELKDRKIFVRLHNVEWEYYKNLSEHESSFFKRSYYKFESSLLKSYERKISNAATLLPISTNDELKFKQLFNGTYIKYLPAFVNSTSINIKEGKGDYCLYHGNLSVAENEKAVFWLIDIMADLDVPLIIAGKNPSKALSRKIEKNKNIRLIKDPAGENLFELIQNAQVNILPFKIFTGLKLKLLHVLFKGRHCLTNYQAIKGTTLEPYCETAETQSEFIKNVKRLFEIPFSNSDIEKRKALLNEFDNDKNAEKLTAWIY